LALKKFELTEKCILLISKMLFLKPAQSRQKHFSNPQNEKQQ